jgi:putative phosphoribosyl transferase
MMNHFKNRRDAGEQLAKALNHYAGKADTIVIGLPRGGVVTAFAVAHALKLPLDIVVPRKIGAPHNPELAVGAITEDGTTIFNHTIMHDLNLHPSQLQTTIEKEEQEAKRRLALYRQNRLPLNLAGKTALIVDDGIATGATMRAAIASARKRGAASIIVAAPVAPPTVIEQLKQEADEVICLIVTDQFWGIGDFYDQFAQTTDNEVITLMSKSRAP